MDSIPECIDEMNRSVADIHRQIGMLLEKVTKPNQWGVLYEAQADLIVWKEKHITKIMKVIKQ